MSVLIFQFIHPCPFPLGNHKFVFDICDLISVGFLKNIFIYLFSVVLVLTAAGLVFSSRSERAALSLQRLVLLRGAGSRCVGLSGCPPEAWGLQGCSSLALESRPDGCSAQA